MVFLIHINFRLCGKNYFGHCGLYNQSSTAQSHNGNLRGECRSVIWGLNYESLVYTFSCSLQQGMHYVVLRFSENNYLKSAYHRFWFKLHWRCWAYGVSKQDGSIWVSSAAANSSRYVKSFQDPQEHNSHRARWSLFRWRHL